MGFNPIEIRFRNSHTPSKASLVPFSIGVPLAKGAVLHPRDIGLEVDGELVDATQVTSLRTWPDGSIKWCQLHWLHAASSLETDQKVRIVYCQNRSFDTPRANPPPALLAGNDSTFTAKLGNEPVGICITATDNQENIYQGRAYNLECKESGPVFCRSVWRIDLTTDAGKSCPLQARLEIKDYATISTMIWRLIVCNPQAAAHPNGNWDLGGSGSVFLNDLSVVFDLPKSFRESEIHGMMNESSVTNDTSLALKNWELFQSSSGGENWQSLNHIDKDRKVRLEFQGYRLTYDGKLKSGLRAKPQVWLSNSNATFAVGMRDFWENFPKSITATGGRVRIGLFPSECSYPHEIQGGEQKTHEFSVYYGSESVDSPLEWFIHSNQARLDPEYYASTGAIRHLTPRLQDSNDLHHQLVDLAILGEDTFVSKREKIDEYGWRNFGDIYGDHEAVYHDGPTPLISHYNNQYDCTEGFAYQFLRTGDFRWLDHMRSMAEHAWDIDTYHSKFDKSAYNGGLFWHTYHYADADTGNHRSYPKSLSESKLMQGGKDLKNLGQTGKILEKNYAIGGGPAPSHNYSTGWMLAYYLTGQEDYRRAAVNAADYVIQIEDGRRTAFRWLSRGNTGNSTGSAAHYFGPGRASGNSLHALLTGYELTEDRKYLDFAEMLIFRVTHPGDDIEKLNLRNVELRWFYVMHFQALARYIDFKRELGVFDYAHSYALSCFNHYAEWMTANEEPNLNQADKLQYPTETWVAQDMRKWHVLQYASWINQADSERQVKFQRKADFFFDYVCQTLREMPTRSLCRPVVLMLQFGWQRRWFLENLKSQPLVPPIPEEGYKTKIKFTPQREIAIKRFKMFIVGCVAFFSLIFVLITISMMRRGL
jgi:hypothetical protein